MNTDATREEDYGNMVRASLLHFDIKKLAHDKFTSTVGIENIQQRSSNRIIFQNILFMLTKLLDFVLIIQSY